MEHKEFWIAIGDLHESTRNMARIPDADRAAGIIITGDLTNKGGKRKAESILGKIGEVNPAVYAITGNMDTREIRSLLENKGMSIQARGIALNERVGLAGVGCSLPTPFGTPSEVSEETLATWLKQAVADIRHLPRTLLATHNPPLNTVADRLSNGRHVGSKAIRQFIDHSQPEVVVTGHIHEAIGEERLQKTKLINPGPFAAGGYVMIQAENGELDAELRRL
jgi:hypothetical protein